MQNKVDSSKIINTTIFYSKQKHGSHHSYATVNIDPLQEWKERADLRGRLGEGEKEGTLHRSGLGGDRVRMHRGSPVGAAAARGAYVEVLSWGGSYRWRGHGRASRTVGEAAAWVQGPPLGAAATGGVDVIERPQGSGGIGVGIPLGAPAAQTSGSSTW